MRSYPNMRLQISVFLGEPFIYFLEIVPRRIEDRTKKYIG